jgi:serine/threonine-protein kinase
VTLAASGRQLQPDPGIKAANQTQLVVTQTASDVGSIVSERYELLAELGSGGMGTVFKARHATLPKLFAIKILKAELSKDTNFRARFDQEAKTASILNHPPLVSIYDHGTSEFGEAYLVMDFIDGHSLAETLTTLRRLEPRQAVRVFTQICEGLTYAHGLGIKHSANTACGKADLRILLIPGGSNLIR